MAGGVGRPHAVEPCEEGDAVRDAGGGARLAWWNRPLTGADNAEESTLRREMATPDRFGYPSRKSGQTTSTKVPTRDAAKHLLRATTQNPLTRSGVQGIPDYANLAVVDSR